MFNTCTYLVNQPTSPISHCHLHCSYPWATVITLLMLWHLHSTTPHYWNPRQPCLAPTPRTGLVSSMLRFPLHPAFALASCVGSLLLLLCNPCVPPFRLLSVSDTSRQATLFSLGMPISLRLGSDNPPWITTDPPPAYLLAQMLNCLAPLNNFADKTVNEGS